MRIAPATLLVNDSGERPHRENHRVISIRGALRSQVRLPGRSERVMPTFRKQWMQTASFSSSHSE
jgi:hypothetical protein